MHTLSMRERTGEIKAGEEIEISTSLENNLCPLTMPPQSK